MARQSRGSCGTIFIALIVLAVIGSIFGDDDDRKEETEKVNQNIETVMENENHGNSFEVNQNIKSTSEGEDSDDDSVWLDGYTDIEDFGYYVDGDGIYVKEYNGNSQKVRLKSSYDIGGRKIKVISFEDGTFKYSDVTGVILPKGTKHLDYDTFANCNIKYLYLPGSVENPGIAFWKELEGVEKIYYGGSAKKWTSICELERNELEVKQIFVNVKPKNLGTEKAENEILNTKTAAISDDMEEGGVTGIEVERKFNYGVIEDFDYDIIGNTVKLNSYDGKMEIIEIQPSYIINGTEYISDISDFQIGVGNSVVKTVIFNEGISEVANAVFNTTDVQNVFFPKSMVNVYDNTLSYLHPEDGKKIKIYYAGTQEEWMNIFTEYRRTKVEDAWESKDAGAVGTALADKLNEMIGSGYDSSEFEYFFSANPDDLKK